MLYVAKQRLRAEDDGWLGAFSKGEDAERAVVTGDENPDDAAEGNTVIGLVPNAHFGGPCEEPTSILFSLNCSCKTITCSDFRKQLFPNNNNIHSPKN